MDISEAAQYMLWQLEQNQLVVKLLPAPEPRHHSHCVRKVAMRNPAWYRDFCAAHPSRRTHPRRRGKPDTAIKRAATQRALQELMHGRCQSLYAQRLLPYVEDFAASWSEQDAYRLAYGD